MCGIAGLIDPNSRVGAAEFKQNLGAMCVPIRHRGPDDSGFYVEEAFGLGLGFRRLAILDLSQEGHQPMQSSSGRYVIVFNGEIYNYESLRRDLSQELGNHTYRGSSDTEVLLTAFEGWGVEKTVRQCRGMFAFALWDRQEKQLWLGRDRLGKKPLFYGIVGGKFFFASELKAMSAHPHFTPELDWEAACEYFQLGYVPRDRCIYKGIRKLLPGTLLCLDGQSLQIDKSIEFWSFPNVISSNRDRLVAGSLEEAARDLEAIILDATSLRMVADVPVGAFLSGGIDSSLVVSMMSQLASKKVETFTIGFDEQEYNESSYAREVSQHLGTDHHEAILTAKDALDVIPKIPWLYDEPVSDASQIATFLVSHVARKRVTVCLSGDGGDELFGGYTRYFWGKKVIKFLKSVPMPARPFLKALLQAAPPSAWNRLGRLSSSLGATALNISRLGEKTQKLARALKAGSEDELFLHIVSQWPDVAALVKRPFNKKISESLTGLAPEGLVFEEKMMAWDAQTYLPDDILAKVDRASMGNSLEVRCPLLDQQVAEFAWRLPLKYKIDGLTTKVILRKILHRHVPEKLFNRPKMGFSLPVDQWLRGPLRDWAESLIGQKTLEQQGVFNAKLVGRVWSEHVQGKRDWQLALWNLLMFQSWIRENRIRV